MSVFKVKLNNFEQGLLDVDKDLVPRSTSLQRTVFVMGPRRINRELKDGDTFTDCNYWKQFAYPQVPLSQAFIEVVSDDGSVWSDIASENTYPKVYDITAVNGTTYEDNVADIASDTGGYATFAQITNKSGSVDVKIRLNGTAILDLPASSTQVFNAGDLSISLIEIDNTSGGSDVDVQILVSVRSIPTS